jgi:hypothetical protein
VPRNSSGGLAASIRDEFNELVPRPFETEGFVDVVNMSEVHEVCSAGSGSGSGSGSGLRSGVGSGAVRIGFAGDGAISTLQRSGASGIWGHNWASSTGTGGGGSGSGAGTSSGSGGGGDHHLARVWDIGFVAGGLLCVSVCVCVCVCVGVCGRVCVCVCVWVWVFDPEARAGVELVEIV